MDDALRRKVDESQEKERKRVRRIFDICNAVLREPDNEEAQKELTELWSELDKKSLA